MGTRKRENRPPQKARLVQPSPAKIKQAALHVLKGVAEYNAIGRRYSIERLLKEQPAIMAEIKEERPILFATAIRKYEKYLREIEEAQKQ